MLNSKRMKKQITESQIKELIRERVINALNEYGTTSFFDEDGYGDAKADIILEINPDTLEILGTCPDEVTGESDTDICWVELELLTKAHSDSHGNIDVSADDVESDFDKIEVTGDNIYEILEKEYGEDESEWPRSYEDTVAEFLNKNRREICERISGELYWYR